MMNRIALTLILFVLPLFAQQPAPQPAPASVASTPTPVQPQSFDAQTQANLNAWLQQALKQIAAQQAQAPAPAPVPPIPALAPRPARRHALAPLSSVTAPVFPANFAFLGAAYNADAVGVPNINAVASYGKALNASGTYLEIAYDAYFIKVAGRVQIVRNERVGMLQYIRSLGPIMLFGFVDGGASQINVSPTNMVTGGSLSGGGFGAIPIRQTGLALTFGARVVASTVAPAGNKSATVYEAGGIFTWN